MQGKNRPEEGSSVLPDHILRLARIGCSGNARDFSAWLTFYGFPNTPENVARALLFLNNEGLIQFHPFIPDEFCICGDCRFLELIQYKIPGAIEYSPIQMARSRLESFLKFFKVSQQDIMDLVIATTEAVENAVKYSNGEDIQIEYGIIDKVFTIKILNKLKDVAPEKDIEAGKYSSRTTLMRGMMVMSKLLDEMNIEIQEENRYAVFTGKKKLV